jgi:hypothetical protein
MLGLNENSQQRTLQVVANPGSDSRRAVYTLGPFFANQGATQVFATASDLTGDGYDEVIFGNYNNVVALTAADPPTPMRGFARVRCSHFPNMAMVWFKGSPR